jgi:hypothetical protein
MTDLRAAVLAGGCQCGAVRYALYARPEGAHICHCRMCQKAVGGPFAALAPIRLANFGWTRGSPGTFLSWKAVRRRKPTPVVRKIDFAALDHHGGEHGAEPADAARRPSAPGSRHLAGLAAP